MEHVAGRTLRDVVRDGGPVHPARALALLEPVLRALAAAHGAGLVHRDVKPENVLLADDGRVKVADFGLARAVETSGLTATTGLLIGTVAYLAPEQVEHGRADTRTDVYAAGILLFELLTGVPPYDSESPMSVAYKHVNEDVPPPSSLVEGIPPALDALVVAATRRDPSARPVDAGAFLAELRAVRADLDPALVTRQREHPTLVVPREAPAAAVAEPAATPPAPAAAARPRAAARRRRRGRRVLAAGGPVRRRPERPRADRGRRGRAPGVAGLRAGRRRGARLLRDGRAGPGAVAGPGRRRAGRARRRGRAGAVGRPRPPHRARRRGPAAGAGRRGAGGRRPGGPPHHRGLRRRARRAPSCPATRPPGRASSPAPRWRWSSATAYGCSRCPRSWAPPATRPWPTSRASRSP